jgi:hypothetical protein
VFVIVISGPIASGKSALSRAVAALLEEERGAAASVIDPDLVYEMLDTRLRPKDDERLWAQTRRIAGRLGTALLGEGRLVVVEGDFATDAALAEFEGELPAETEVRLVLLDVDFETALHRVRSDESRGVSKDRAFLSAHYAEFRAEWLGRDALKLNSGSASPTETARTVVEWLTAGG